MVAFNEVQRIVVCTHHAADRWMERVGFSGSREEAQDIIASGIMENGRLVLTINQVKDGLTHYYCWMGLIFPLVQRENDSHKWIAKTTLLWGMTGFQ